MDRQLKILHLFSDWKWTGPADPVLNICRKLSERGHRVFLAFRCSPGERLDSLDLRVRGTRVLPVRSFSLNRHWAPGSVLAMPGDVFGICRFIRDQEIDVVNCHLSHDHWLGGLAARLSASPVVLIRTDHKRDSIAPTPANRLLLTRLTDGIITFSERARRMLVTGFGMESGRVQQVNPGVDIQRFRPLSSNDEFRMRLGLGAEDFVVGVVARFQHYRKMDLFFSALAEVAPQIPRLRALLAGRGSQMASTVIRPVEKLGLESRVILAGYRTIDYLNTIACMDLFVFLMPGSDGTGRALREVMALGKPVLVNDVGMLAEIVDDGVDGVLFNDTAPDLAGKLIRLANNADLRKRLGQAARRKAENAFSLELQAGRVEEFYRSIRPWAPRRRRALRF